MKKFFSAEFSPVRVQNRRARFTVSGSAANVLFQPRSKQGVVLQTAVGRPGSIDDGMWYLLRKPRPNKGLQRSTETGRRFTKIVKRAAAPNGPAQQSRGVLVLARRSPATYPIVCSQPLRLRVRRAASDTHLSGKSRNTSPSPIQLLRSSQSTPARLPEIHAQAQKSRPSAQEKCLNSRRCGVGRSVRQ